MGSLYICFVFEKIFPRQYLYPCVRYYRIGIKKINCRKFLWSKFDKICLLLELQMD